MLKKLALAFAGLLLLALLVPVASCNNGSTTSSTSSTGTTTDTSNIKIGSVMDLSGSLSSMGALISDGVKLAVQQINAAGGINGRQVELITEDGGTDATISFNAFKKLVEVNGCKVIIGPMTSGAVKACADYALTNKVLLISPSATSPDIAQQLYRQFVFRTAPNDIFQGKAMAQLVTDGGYKKVVIFAMNNSYGSGIADVVNQQLTGKTTILKSMTYDPNKLDYLTELQTIKDLNPDCVVHVGYEADADIVYKQAAQLGLNIQWVAPEGVYSPGTLDVPEAAQFMAAHVIGTRPTAPEGLAAYTTFANAFQAAFSTPAGTYCDNAYDAANLAFAAFKAVGTTDTTAIAAKVLALANNYSGASGTITMNQYGDRVGGFYEVWNVIKTGSTYAYGKV
jgi:ABC-type branched-subunit amino acid transport system substrate-binding protein